MKKIFIIEAFFGIITTAVLVFLLITYISYFHKKIDAGHQTVRVYKNESITNVIKELAGKGIIKNPSWLWYYYKVTRTKVQAGVYYFSGRLSPLDIVKKLKLGKVETVSLTFPEGITAKSVVNILEANRVIKPGSISENIYPFIEGYLFPDTYNFKIDEGAVSAITKMMVHFQNKTKRFDFASKKLRKILIIASLIEKESIRKGRKVSEVIYNRLKRNMPLGLDSALQYALGKNRLTHADFNAATPYNLYKNRGLPPTPISNPSLKAIQYASDAPKGDLLYFLSRNGSTFFFTNYKKEKEWIRIHKKKE
ncbi:MAG: endolytic transglycosylase MltG [Epsilonproteobacteria bacterium]|nr:endolytic transglycosylase MltG [Campylobacterota bacterium]